MSLMTKIIALANDSTPTNMELFYSDGGSFDGPVSLSSFTANAKTAMIARMERVYLAQGSVYKYVDLTDETPSELDWDAGPGSTLPESANIGCQYRGRCVLAGDPSAPNVWYMSRQGDFTDWNYTKTDAQAAVYGSGSIAGNAGGVITSLIPFSDDYLVIGCSNMVNILKGTQ